MEIFPNLDVASHIFGKHAKAYSELFSRIGDEIFAEEYKFMDNELFEKVCHDPLEGIDLGQRIIWEEILARAHMASVSSIIRTSRWIDTAIWEYEAGNLYGWAGACRSLLEGAGDILHSLGSVPLTLAQNLGAIQSELSGHERDTRIDGKELEDILIHFLFARKISKGELVPESHKTEPSWKYIKSLEEMHKGSNALYSELCEIVHPAASSVGILFEATHDEWRLSATKEKNTLHSMAAMNKYTLANALEASFNPPIMTLKVLQKFKLFKKIKGLRNTGLETLEYWKKVEAFF